MNVKFALLGLTVTALIAVNSQHSPKLSLITPMQMANAGEIDRSKSADNEQCNTNDESMNSCRSFIKGFLKGALLTDIAIIKSIDEEAQETFAERAIKTRLNRRDESPTELAGFCLPIKRSIADLAEETLLHVKDSPRDSHELARNVYRSLKTDFPCNKPED